MADEKAFLTPPQMARLIGVSEDKILAWIHSGELRAVNTAQNADGERPRWRISRDEIERFFNARANKPTEPIKPVKRRRRTVAAAKEWF